MITFVTNLKSNFKIVTVMDKELIKRTLDDVISRMFRFLPVITLTILSNYYTTYVERDLRQLINLKDLRLFHNFIRLYV